MASQSDGVSTRVQEDATEVRGQGWSWTFARYSVFCMYARNNPFHLL
jgi:hypothetical protein